jgi:glycine dehydrogenase
LKNEIEKLGFKQQNLYFFDTLRFELTTQEEINQLRKIAENHEINFYYKNQTVQISVDETSSHVDINKIVKIFSEFKNSDINPQIKYEIKNEIPKHLTRSTDFLTHEVFNQYHSETKMLRYLKRLENKDLSLTLAMIPLGSCTMKLNATSEMLAISWKEFSQLHPFAPLNQAEGYLELFGELEDYLCKITGFDACSLQPNSGAQGEYAGLLAIKNYFKSKSDNDRTIVLIPSSAHGTNPATASMLGFKIITVSCDENGNVNVEDLKNKVKEFDKNIAALMITYPSTHGVFEEKIVEICQVIHQVGGQVYMDGANMNAQVGLTSPGFIGADVCHLNLHKTFAIPHGGGGPGMGPICVKKHLEDFLPGHIVHPIKGRKSYAVSAAPWGSASVLTISHAYIKMLGEEGVTQSTRIAILHANYIKARLEKHYPILYQGVNNRVAHELIVDVNTFKKEAGIEVDDIAKRLIDYGFHAPTMSFPVAGTLMIEPTESEDKKELDRFCDAMISIRKEIEAIKNGELDREDNPLKNAPHTSKYLISDDWNHKYSRELAAYPMENENFKYWSPVGRIDNTYGDKNLFCSCIPVE